MTRGFGCCVIGLPLLLALLSLTGCEFDRRWDDMKRSAVNAQTQPAAPAPAATQPHADPLAGRWEGKWISDVNGHSGRLRAIITFVPQTTIVDRMYRADFDATFFGFMRAGYSITLTTPWIGRVWIAEFTGKKDLGGLAGGVYEYRGAADGTTFDAKYESKSDHGTFHMTRPIETSSQ